MKLRKGTFQHIEAELYAYQDTKKEIQRLRDEILYSSPSPDENGGGRSNLPSDGVALAVVRLTSDKRLNALEDISEAVETVYGRLTTDRQKLMKLRYWTKPQLLTWDGIARELNVGRATAIRWRNEIVFAIAERLGWR